MSNDSPSIQLEDVNMQFGEGPRILESINFKAKPGEMIGIVGPSGCGKSTLLRMIAGLIPVNSGKIKIEPEKPEIAFIFQDATLLPWKTVRDNIATPLQLRKIPKPERNNRAEELAEQVGLESSLGKFPRQLSGGMMMRVSLARALSVDPKLILFDEPFGALDAITRNQLNEDILELQRASGWTGFFVTHSVNEAVFLSDRLIILSQNPARLEYVVDITLDRPRNTKTRESMEFQKTVASVSSKLHEVLQ